ncbi:MAG TPA: hypothetical protein VFT27_03740, partial [Actinomycetota bacterium]|nr:hypothetical protein [Actinomycetota bacterium]
MPGAVSRGRVAGAGRHAPILLLLLALLGTACASDGDDGASPSATAAGSQVVAIVASVDLWAGDPQRVSVGLVTNDNRLVSYGSADFAFSYIGTAEEPAEPQAGPTATATFVPTYGTNGDGGETPTITLPSEARGVYEATDVTFDQAGFWQVTVTADVADVGPQTALATFPVAEEAALPAPGDSALPTENLTVDSKGVPVGAIDSR